MYKRLVFCGGGTRVLFFLPSLVVFEESGLLTDINDYWGTSAGGLLAACMALTKSASKTLSLLHAFDYTKFRDMDISNLFTINQAWGLDDGISMIKEIERVFELIHEGASTKTLRECPELHIVVTDLTIHETLILDSTSYPNVRIVEAIRASMGVPLLYKPYQHKPSGHYWVDGALRANFPWEFLPSDAARSEALGFLFEKSWQDGPRNFSDYMFSMIHFDEPKKISYLKRDWDSNIVWYPTPPYPAWFMTLNEEDFQMIDSVGKAAAHRWLASRQKGDSLCPPGRTETLAASAGQNTHPPSFPQHCITESSGSHLPSQEPSRDSSQPQSHYTPPSFRRWSV